MFKNEFYKTVFYLKTLEIKAITDTMWDTKKVKITL